jgi:aldose 1-epimerase
MHGGWRFALALVAASVTPSTPVAAQVQERAADEPVTLRRGDMTVELIAHGATVTRIIVPDRRGRRANVVLGYRTPAEYRARNHRSSFGATMGRYAGRIAGARFTLDGRPVQLQANDGGNALHGGGDARFDTVDWRLTARSRHAATFRLDSPDGFQGFPGRVQVSVTYRLLPGRALRIDYAAQTDRATVLNLTNHAYFNLAGEGSGSVRAQRLQVAASRYVATDAAGIPTGALPAVTGTPLDLRRARRLGSGIDSRVPPMGDHGFNHAWLFDKPAGRLAPVARLSDPASGRTLAVATTEPSIQVYTAGYLDGSDRGPSGRPMQPYDGVALETQHLADSPNHPAFPTTVLRPGETLRSTTLWRFGTR